MSLRFLPGEAVSAVTGKTLKAVRAECDCGEAIFTVFQVTGHTHFHIMCPFCHAVYCPAGACEKETPQ